MSEHGLRYHICEITLIYAGVRMCPKVMRDMFAFAYLTEHKIDFPKLANHLWHRDVLTTYLYYATCFDPSFGTVHIENWYKERRAREKMRGQVSHSGAGATK